MPAFPREIVDLQSANYSAATEPCDLVMKGGVTSGVVYPTAICRMARTFRFHSIGGTSAGALAAALAAAAEYDRVRDSRSSRGFQRLAGVSEYLGTGSNLRDLFQPSPSTQALFKLGMAWIEKPGWSFALAVLGAYRLWVAVAFVLGVVAERLIATTSHDESTAVLVAAIVFCAALISLVWWRIKAAVQGAIPDNDFGLCTGFKRPNPFAPPPLTPWLADRIDYVAGRTYAKGQPDDSTLVPLTFGDLYGEPNPANNSFPGGSPVLDNLNAVGQRAVNLEMVTTDVTAGRPYRLPFDDDDVTQFFYNRTELSRFFPNRVLDRMTGDEITITLNDPAKPNTPQQVAVMPFPSAADLPVIVAARMSMSFPMLFSAVPLYAVNRKAFRAWSSSGGAQPEFGKTWFSDGGLSSNLPIHFFDGPIPRWPTFALNLRGTPRTHDGLSIMFPEKPTDEEKVFPATSYDPDVEQFDLGGDRRLFQFANSLLDAMRNWNDNTLLQLPGYRERTVEIAMTAAEGGLNLTMPEEVVQSIMARGVFAGERFVSTFGPELARSDAWNDHRLIRLRASLLMQSEWSRRYAVAWNRDPDGAPTYEELIKATKPPYSIPYETDERASASTFANALASISDAIAPGVTLTKEPTPSTELRARPRI